MGVAGLHAGPEGACPGAVAEGGRPFPPGPAFSPRTTASLSRFLPPGPASSAKGGRGRPPGRRHAGPLLLTAALPASSRPKAARATGDPGHARQLTEGVKRARARARERARGRDRPHSPKTAPSRGLPPGGGTLQLRGGTLLPRGGSLLRSGVGSGRLQPRSLAELPTRSAAQGA